MSMMNSPSPNQSPSSFLLSPRTQQVMTFIGCFTMLLPNTVTLYWGNVSIYVYSYFHSQQTKLTQTQTLDKTKTLQQIHQVQEDFKAPWLLSMYVISVSMAVMVSGYINNKIGKRATILLGVALFEGGLISSYFVLGESMECLDVTMGVLCGFGCGLMHSTLLQITVEWTSSHLGLVTALLFMSYAIGSIVTNQVITHYLNPENQKVDVVIGKTHFFSQECILDKVPSMFLALSTASGVFHFIGFSLIRMRPIVKNIKLKDRNAAQSNSNLNEEEDAILRKASVHLPQSTDLHDRNNNNGNSRLGFNETRVLRIPRSGSFNLPRKNNMMDVNNKNNNNNNIPRSGSVYIPRRSGSFHYSSDYSYNSLAPFDPRMEALSRLNLDPHTHHYDYMRATSEWSLNSDVRDSRARSLSTLSYAGDDSLLDSLNTSENEKTPSEVLRTRFFFVIWFIIFGADSAFICLSNYYKVFGQMWIKDDHFLTDLGTTSAACTSIMRIAWGILTDYLEIKPALVSFTSGLALILTSYFFTASVSKWLFFVVNILFSCLYCGIYVNFVVAVRSLYGRINFTKNYGMLASATIIVNVAFPPLTKIILSQFGWFWLFFGIGFANFCSLLLVVFMLKVEA